MIHKIAKSINLSAIALKILAPKARAFEKAARNPKRAQEDILFDYLRRNKNTEYGKKYRFNHIRSVMEYQRSLPITNCEGMRPYLERMMRGENNILTADRPIFFGVTSGTTNKPKYIPATGYSDKKKKELMDLWGYYIARDHPEALNGKILAIVSSEVEGYAESGIPFGGESGHSYNKLPWVIKLKYVVPYEVFQIEDYDSRYYTILRISMAHDITTIATLNPNSITLLCQKVKGWQDRLISDIEKGTLDASLKIPAATRKIVEQKLKPQPGRARELKEILKAHGELLPKHYWPNLGLIECWKGGTMKLYLDALNSYSGGVPIRDIGCLSTEARSSIPITDEGAGGVLAIQTNFYEFIPKENIDNFTRMPLMCDELEKGREYFIIVSTPGGLYRYNIDDVIKVDGFFNNTPVIEFVQKGLNVVSLAGEKLYEVQVNEALQNVNKRLKLIIKFFCMVVDMGSIPRYAFLAEFGDEIPSDKITEFAKMMESELRKQNREYDYVRQAQLLKNPVLKIVKKGEYERFRAKKISEGAHDSQFKTPELTPDTSFEKNFTYEEIFSVT